jgi:hypothetical protein
LLIISKDNKPSRSPNAFIIYRKVFLKTTRDQGYFLPMTIVSSMASKSWDQEPSEIRNYYKKLSKEAYNYRTEKFPKKVKRRRKKEPWNGNVSFQNDLRNTMFDNTNSTENLSSSPEPQSIKPSPDMFYSSNNDVSSQDSSPNLEQQINESSFFNENNNFQDLFPSPDLSNNNSISSSPNINEYSISDNPELLINQPTEFDLYNQANLLLLDQNNISYFNEFSNSSNNQINYSDNFDYNTACSTADLYSTDLLPYQNVLGINLNPIGAFSYL